ncbi:MAG: dienelactone hydrolase family protein [Methanomicrobiaceae archaeon]|nr:dienelactone hydrolase family protein [Methanomicrobiaceae archaeon]
MRRILLVASLAALLFIAGCVSPDNEGNGMERNGAVQNGTVDIESAGQIYPAYIASPVDGGPFPAVVLIHSFNGLEPGYREMGDHFAAEGYVVIAPEWQTHEQAPGDDSTEALIRDTIAYLDTRPDVDTSSLGLTGFCAGGRYTMLYLPLIEEFTSGVAWYGFPFSGGPGNGTPPVEFIDEITDPMLIIHGTADQASPVAEIYQYATELDAAGKYFELKIYQGEPHGFMIEDGALSESFVALDAYQEMVDFFDRTLG